MRSPSACLSSSLPAAHPHSSPLVLGAMGWKSRNITGQGQSQTMPFRTFRCNFPAPSPWAADFSAYLPYSASARKGGLSCQTQQHGEAGGQKKPRMVPLRRGTEDSPTAGSREQDGGCLACAEVEAGKCCVQNACSGPWPSSGAFPTRHLQRTAPGCPLRLFPG